MPRGTNNLGPLKIRSPGSAVAMAGETESSPPWAIRFALFLGVGNTVLFHLWGWATFLMLGRREATKSGPAPVAKALATRLNPGACDIIFRTCMPQTLHTNTHTD